MKRYKFVAGPSTRFYVNEGNINELTNKLNEIEQAQAVLGWEYVDMQPMTISSETGGGCLSNKTSYTHTFYVLKFAKEEKSQNDNSHKYKDMKGEIFSNDSEGFPVKCPNCNKIQLMPENADSIICSGCGKKLLNPHK